MKTGKQLWPGPALVRNRGVFLTQPPDVPFLVFADRQQTRNVAADGGSQLRVLCLDKRTGETVYRNDHLTDTATPRFRIRAEDLPHPLVSVELGAARIQLAMTDRPRPPQPPTNDDWKASRESSSGAFAAWAREWAVPFGRIGRTALRTHQLQQPQKQIRPQNGDAKPAKNAANDTDDD